MKLERIYLASYEQGGVDWFRHRLDGLTAVAVGWVGVRVAAALGGTSFDSDHWVMRHDGNHGSPGATETEHNPITQPLFRHIDFADGDRLLLLIWNEEPPPIWFG